MRFKNPAFCTPRASASTRRCTSALSSSLAAISTRSLSRSFSFSRTTDSTSARRSRASVRSLTLAVPFAETRDGWCGERNWGFGKHSK
eukprot:98600-Chlamydomonas_euryale.AAC.1